MTQELLFEIRDGIGFVTLNRPAARNALTFAMYARLAEIAADPGAARALVITGAGDKAFAAGTDIGQFRDFRTAEDAIAYEAKLDHVNRHVGALPRPNHRGDRGRLYRWRGRHRGGLRSANCGGERAVRISHRADAWELPVHRQRCSIVGADRPGAGDRNDLHSATAQR